MKFRLKEIRERNGISQADLSQILNVSPSAVGMWEQGRREPSYEKLCRIAEIFNVSTDYLLGRDKVVFSPNKENRSLIRNFESLTTDGQNMILGMLNSLKVTHAVSK